MKGSVRNRKTGDGLGGYQVTASEAERRGEKDAVVGQGVTSLDGGFLLRYSPEFSRSVGEDLRGGSDVVLELRNRFGQPVHAAPAIRGAGRFREREIEIEVKPELEKPKGVKKHDTFEPVRAVFGEEVAALEANRVATPKALIAADLDSLAEKTGIGADRLGALRLAVEVPALDRTKAETLSRAGVRSRDSLAQSEPAELASRLDSQGGSSAKAAEITEWVARAQGHDVDEFMVPMDEPAVKKGINGVYAAVRENNPRVVLTDVEFLMEPVARMTAMARARALMNEAGVSDLSRLGTYRIPGRRVFRPGYYVAMPPLTKPGDRGKEIATHTGTLVQHGKKFKSVEMDDNVLHFVHNPVTEAVIIGSVVDCVEDGELVIASEVTSLVIITEEIRHSEVNRITYENRDEQPEPVPDFAQLRAATGSPDWSTNEYAAGEGNKGANGGDGLDGADGDPGFEGDEVGPAPTVEIYVQSTPEGLPDIDLGGRRGGRGQNTQHGGHGGDGARGRPSKGELFWCKRGVGHGGDGGNGGRGGNGGTGGVGGTGGDVTVYSLEDNIVDLVSGREAFLSNSGGAGGSGGARGIKGDPGRGVPRRETRVLRGRAQSGGPRR